MTINPYFGNQNGHPSEQNLTEDLIIEMIQLSGRNWIYIPRNTGNIDEILNEASLASFDEYSVIEMYLNNYTDFGGNNMLLNQIGFKITSQLELVVAKKRFKEEVQDKPLAGDLVYEPLSKMIFQIDFVDDEPNLNYQLQKNYTYMLKCSPFTHSYEDFATGVQDVDNDLNSDTFEDNFDNQDNINTEVEDNDYMDFSETNPLGIILPQDDD